MTERGVDRRSVLRVSGTGIVGSLVGCLVTKEKSIEPPPFGPPATDWPMVGYDAANTGFSPDATGPKNEPELEWGIQFEQDDNPHFALAGKSLVVAGDDELYCFDLERGEEAWQIDGDETNPVAIDAEEGLVYAGPEQSRLSAYDLEDGSEQWHVPMNETLTPPVVHEGTVYVSDHAGTIVGIDTADGTERWRFSADNRPEGRLATDGEFVVSCANIEIDTLDAADGNHRWTVDYHHNRPPILDEKTVYAGREVFRAFDVTDGEHLWERDLGRGFGSTLPPVFAKGTIYFGSPNGYVRTVDAASGEFVWEADEEFGMVTAKPSHDEATLFLGSGDRGGGGMAALESDDGTVRWRWSFEVGEYADRISIVGDRLLIATGRGRLVSLVEPS